MLTPKKLESGHTVGVVAPSRSLSIVNSKWIGLAEEFFAQRGIKVKFAEHCMERWHENGGSVEQRVNDLMSMFSDDNIDGIITAIGGFNSNQLLEHLDYEVIRRNPKIFVGYSDITALHSAIHTKTGLVTFSGPHFSTLGQPFPLDYTVQYFDEVLMGGKEGIELKESEEFAEDEWYEHPADSRPRALKKNPGWSVVREGSATGELFGGNIVTLQALVGTPYMPDTAGKILFLEDCIEASAAEIDRALTHMQQAGLFKNINGLLVGRFPTKIGIDQARLNELILRVADETDAPVITGLDFGHTDPMATMPIGIPCLMDTFARCIRLTTSAVQ